MTNSLKSVDHCLRAFSKQRLFTALLLLLQFKPLCLTFTQLMPAPGFFPGLLCVEETREKSQYPRTIGTVAFLYRVLCGYSS